MVAMKPKRDAESHSFTDTHGVEWTCLHTDVMKDLQEQVLRARLIEERKNELQQINSQLQAQVFHYQEQLRAANIRLEGAAIGANALMKATARALNGGKSLTLPDTIDDVRHDLFGSLPRVTDETIDEQAERTSPALGAGEKRVKSDV